MGIVQMYLVSWFAPTYLCAHPANQAVTSVVQRCSKPPASLHGSFVAKLYRPIDLDLPIGISDTLHVQCQNIVTLKATACARAFPVVKRPNVIARSRVTNPMNRDTFGYCTHNKLICPRHNICPSSSIFLIWIFFDFHLFHHR